MTVMHVEGTAWVWWIQCIVSNPILHLVTTSQMGFDYTVLVGLIDKTGSRNNPKRSQRVTSPIRSNRGCLLGPR